MFTSRRADRSDYHKMTCFDRFIDLHSHPQYHTRNRCTCSTLRQPKTDCSIRKLCKGTLRPQRPYTPLHKKSNPFHCRLVLRYLYSRDLHPIIRHLLHSSRNSRLIDDGFHDLSSLSLKKQQPWHV